MKRTIFIGLVALLLALSALVLPTPGAHKASAAALPLTDTVHCASVGSLIESDNIMAGSTKVGELDIYYNSSTGYNCAYTRSASSNWGVPKQMEVMIITCANTSPSNSCNTAGGKVDYDGGTYSYYAGPVGLYAPGHCIFVEGDVYGQYLNGTGYWHATGASHCG